MTRPLLLIQWPELHTDHVRRMVPIMGTALRQIADAVERGEGVGEVNGAHWHIETEVTIEEIVAAMHGGEGAKATPQPSAPVKPTRASAVEGAKLGRRRT
jgi:hypothetical protein